MKCPSHVPLYQAWACLELRSENIERAKILISEALTRDKSRGSSWRISAKIEEKLGNGGLVRLILQRGLECSPCDPELYRAAAELEVKRGHFHTVRVFIASFYFNSFPFIISLYILPLGPVLIRKRIGD